MRRLFGGVAGVLVLAGLGFGWKLFFATELGGSCSDSNECRGLSGECLQDSTGSYCTQRCAGNPDCPAGWTCTTADASGGGAGATAVCARPFPGAPTAMTAMPMTAFPATGFPMTGFPMTGFPMTGFPMTAQ